MYALSVASKRNRVGHFLQQSYNVAAIRVHLSVTWLALWLKPKTLLSSRRRSMLRSLRHYWIRGSFPINKNHPSFTPVFRDNYGTLCAMGYLAHSDKQAALVAGIVANNNLINLSYEYNPEFDAWLQTTGISYSEASRILPGYPWQEHGDKLFGDRERILVALMLIPLYICLIGAYLIVGKRILRPGSVSRVVFVASVTIAILAEVSSLLFLAYGELN